jgi:hypothetical protein
MVWNAYRRVPQAIKICAALHFPYCAHWNDALRYVHRQGDDGMETTHVLSKIGTVAANDPSRAGQADSAIMDLTHLHYLELSLSHERARLDAAKRPGERLVRAGWVAQIEKEIAAERIFLGIAEPLDRVMYRINRMSDDELLAALGNPERAKQ